MGASRSVGIPSLCSWTPRLAPPMILPHPVTKHTFGRPWELFLPHHCVQPVSKMALNLSPASHPPNRAHCPTLDSSPPPSTPFCPTEPGNTRDTRAHPAPPARRAGRAPRKAGRGMAGLPPPPSSLRSHCASAHPGPTPHIPPHTSSRPPEGLAQGPGHWGLPDSMYRVPASSPVMLCLELPSSHSLDQLTHIFHLENLP